jgi:hypothetical protein
MAIDWRTLMKVSVIFLFCLLFSVLESRADDASVQLDLHNMIRSTLKTSFIAKEPAEKGCYAKIENYTDPKTQQPAESFVVHEKTPGILFGHNDQVLLHVSFDPKQSSIIPKGIGNRGDAIYIIKDNNGTEFSLSIYQGRAIMEIVSAYEGPAPGDNFVVCTAYPEAQQYDSPTLWFGQRD